MNNLEYFYNLKRTTPSDINEHLPTLYDYAKRCNTIAEFGVRDVCSSYALALASPQKLICVDIKSNDNITNFINLCKKENINAVFHQANTLEYELEEVDMLFIDTLHSFNQLSLELTLHASKVKKYLIFHDTISFGYMDEDTRKSGESCGLVPALKIFLRDNPNWKETETYTNNNGLTILTNTNSSD
jgi:hypothetical protein